MMLKILLLTILVTQITGEPFEKWWQKTPIYQIYPRSFKDSDGDGVGDLKGITMYMDHFVDAGIKAFWLSPIYKSPMIDFGYDISDFRAIDEIYGTMEDFEDLIRKAKNLGLKVILDFVPNHASNESDYFKLSVNRTKGYEDFFIWDDGLPDPNNPYARMPPSNWVSQFQGSAWEWNDQRGQFYLHQFSTSQLDLNYRNPIVVEEMKNVVTFWLDKGVDGFRIDALPYMYEADKNEYGGRYPDDPLSGAPGLGPGDLGYTIPIYSKDRAETYDMVYQWRQLLDEYSKKDGEYRLMMTEGYANRSSTFRYYDAGSDVPFNFDFITYLNNKSKAEDYVNVVYEWLNGMPEGKTANWVLGNHDNSRMGSRFGSDYIDGLNMFQAILPGVSVIYQGDEIGMVDGYVSYEDTVDVSGCNAGPEDYQKFSRDPARTPFQWSNNTNADFSTAQKTWLPIASNYKELNLKNQKLTERSTFKVFQKLSKLRSTPALLNGTLALKALSEGVIGMTRIKRNEEYFAFAFNVGKKTEKVDLFSNFLGLPRKMRIHVVSVNSKRRINDYDDLMKVTLEKGEAVIYSSR